MTINRKPTGTALSIPAGLAAGTVAALVTTMVGALITARLLDREIISWDHCGYGVLVILLLSAWTGSLVTIGKVRRQRLALGLAAGGAYFVSLMLGTALFFGGQYSGVGETGLLIFCGSMLGVFTGFGGKTGRNRRKIKGRNR